jgi:DNA-binding NarL/FixJ family response regulator
VELASTVGRDRIKLLVVDDHALVREGVRHTLESLSCEVQVFEAKSGGEAVHLVERQSDFDLVLLDLQLPDIDGFQALTRLRERNPDLPVVILSASDERPDVVSALNMGAVGFIPKSYTRELMLNAVRLVLAGGVYIPPHALGFTGSPKAEARRVQQHESIGSLGLTQRQLQVLSLLAQGKPNKIIARDLNITEPTVKSHVTQILRALKVTNRSQAVIAARRLGFGN